MWYSKFFFVNNKEFFKKTACYYFLRTLTMSTITKKNIDPLKELTLIEVEQSLELHGELALSGAKNAVLVIMASLILTKGKSILRNVPNSTDVHQMIWLLQDLGASVFFYPEKKILEIDATSIKNYKVVPEIMKKTRASVLVMGPLLVRFSRAEIALPGGCLIGKRPIDFHIKNFTKMGVVCEVNGDFLCAYVTTLKATRLVLEYPSIGATENLLMAAVMTPGVTHIINAALEPEVLDLIHVLKKMGAKVTIFPPSSLYIEGVSHLSAIDHEVIVDRLEAGCLLLAAAITGGTLSLPQARAEDLDVFLLKLEEMGHVIEREVNQPGIKLIATKSPQAVSLRTAPYPGFPTDLQAPMMAILSLARGVSVIHETVFENRFLQVRELQKMGAQIRIKGDYAHITGVDRLYGTSVIATDIRASCSLVLAGLAAKGKTVIAGVHHWQRGYDALEKKLRMLGAKIELKSAD